MKGFLSKVTASTLDLLFPIQCAGCRKESRIICEECLPGLAELMEPFCNLCASPKTVSPCRDCMENPPAVDGIRAPYLFEGAIREAVHSLTCLVLQYQRGLKCVGHNHVRLLLAPFTLSDHRYTLY